MTLLKEILDRNDGNDDELVNVTDNVRQSAKYTSIAASVRGNGTLQYNAGYNYGPYFVYDFPYKDKDTKKAQKISGKTDLSAHGKISISNGTKNDEYKIIIRLGMQTHHLMPYGFSYHVSKTFKKTPTKKQMMAAIPGLYRKFKASPEYKEYTDALRLETIKIFIMKNYKNIKSVDTSKDHSTTYSAKYVESSIDERKVVLTKLYTAYGRDIVNDIVKTEFKNYSNVRFEQNTVYYKLKSSSTWD